MKYDIFISYRREDSSGRSNAPTARQFKLAFEAPPYNYKVFFDYSECTDDYFTDTILSAIRTCDYFVLVLTKDSLARCSNEGDWVRREIEEAIASKKKIVPITPDKECESFPQELPDSLRKAFDGLQITTIYTDSMFESGIEYLVKNRFHNPKIDCPEGAIKGVFSVSPTKKVYFSKGNLQYQISTKTWRFAEQQFDCIGDANNIEEIHGCEGDFYGYSDNRDVIDLFDWGTGDNPTKFGAQDRCSNFVDWGKNRISNGGNEPNTWGTLTAEEWAFVFKRRHTISGVRYAKARVNNVNGIVLLPDNCGAWLSCCLINPNQERASFEDNVISLSQWDTMQGGGAVFLPAAGYRGGLCVGGVGSSGYYWSISGDRYSWSLYFSKDNLNLDNWVECDEGLSVRLVFLAEN